MNIKQLLKGFLFGIAASAATTLPARADQPDPSLRVVIIRHGEKPNSGDNLSCQGLNRALALPPVLNQKFGIPNHTYVPSLDTGSSTSHSRMFQTVTPMAAKYNLTINSKFDSKDFKATADDVLQKKKTILMVWEHSAIQGLAAALGVDNPKKWPDDDFDSIWIITYPNGKAVFTKDKENITPSADCPF